MAKQVIVLKVPYKTYKMYLQERFPEVAVLRKVSLNAGNSCPNLDGTVGRGGCTYCNNNSFSPSLSYEATSIQEQLAEGKKRIQNRFPKASFLAYFQPYTNTHGAPERLAMQYQVALDDPDVIALAIGTRPDCLSTPVIEVLKEAAAQKPIILEVGLQTANDDTLRRTNRCHTVAQWHQAMESLYNIPGLDLVAHVILGLPGDTWKDWRNTALAIAQHPVQSVKIHPLHIVNGTVMARQYQAGEFALCSFEEYVAGVTDFIERTRPNCAIERFTGVAPDHLHVAPDWSHKREMIVEAVVALLEERGSAQGCML